MKYRSAISTLTIFIALLALACNSTGPIANIFATPTFTSTVTPSASPTITPSPSPSASPTPLPTGIMIEKLTGETTRVVDYDMGYFLVLNKDWLPLNADSESIKEAMDAAGKENPELATAREYIENILRDDAVRLLAFNTDKRYREGGFITNLVILTMQDSILEAMPLDLFIELNVEEINRKGSNAKMVTSGVAENNNMVAFGYIILDNNAFQDGRTLPVRQFIVVIKVETAMVFFTLTIPNSVEGTAEIVYQDFLDSLYLLEGPTTLTYQP